MNTDTARPRAQTVADGESRAEKHRGTAGMVPHGHVVAVDLGGTEIKAALVAHDGGVIRRVRRATRRERGPEAVVGQVAETAQALADDAVETFGTPPLAVGVAVPGIVAEGAGRAVYSANLGWRDLPLRDLMTERLGLPVVLGHDVRAGAVAEGRLGAARDRDEFLFAALGTGIAAAHVRGGLAHGGSGGGAGELGHLTVRRGGPACGCGNQGCLETLASASAVARRYTRAARRTAAGRAAGHVSAEEVSRLAATGDPLARRIWQDAVETLAEGLAAYTVLCDPGLVVLGGGLARSGEALLGPVRAALAGRLRFHAVPDLVAAELGAEAGCRGAGLLALDALSAPLPGP
ncbi:ROK family protein [Streptomyces sp. NBC_00059]|uniref:ROK family protein n=1 Tax=Streptomyces sp. NBC_00059 TaxID=2975635 RepID=UPI002B1D1CF6|nr:ROK family protein [Streptomyces sp. NBC_00059]